jgi:magnesium chelatase family protein
VRVVGVLSGQLDRDLVVPRVEEMFGELKRYDLDFSDVRGQEFANRALMVASGGHTVLMM